MAITTLAHTLTYENEAVVLRFLETWEIPRAEADDLFEQTKRWLWLAATLEGTPRSTLIITPSTKLIDEMWHTFMLFSREYAEFCEKFFGFFVHHRPTPRSEYLEQIARHELAPDAYRAEQGARLEQQFAVVLELLGEGTLVKWYSDYLERYSEARLHDIWRWSFSPYETRARQHIRLATGAPEPART
jgi:hypothetical protein